MGGLERAIYGFADEMKELADELRAILRQPDLRHLPASDVLFAQVDAQFQTCKARPHRDEATFGLSANKK